MENNKKVFNDPIHGNIELHPLCVKIVDTPQFQRLRFIKQLGGAYFVYPGAAHNRFEHSIGVCHLAGRLVRALRDQKSEALKDVDITPMDELCVEIAALCHDLGHGPFSHLFDRKIIPKLRKDKKWKHENGSVDMLRYMLEENEGELGKEFEKENLTSLDRKFIEELIVGRDNTSPKDSEYEKRIEKKEFLFEIVSNKRNGIDVDKWDYFARDCHMLGIGNNFNHDRCIAFSRVINVDGERQICFRNKEAANLYDMFHTRYLLHHRAYQHKTNNIIEYMIAEALRLADGFITFTGQGGKKRKMSEAIDDMEAYSLLNDCVIYNILGSTETNDEMKKSQNIIKRVLQRDLYKFVGEKRFAYNRFQKKEKFKELLRETPGITSDTRYEDVKDKLKNEPRYENVDTDAEREQYFNESVADLKKEKFKELLRETPGITSDTRYEDVKDKLKNEPFYENVDTDAEREQYFNESVADLELENKERTKQKEFLIENKVIDEMRKFNTEGDMRKVNAGTKKCSIIVDVVDMNYGKKNENPIDFVNFYQKENPDKAERKQKEDVSLLLPKDFAEQLVRVYCKDPERHTEVKKIFDNWSKNTKSGTKKQKTAP